MDRLTLKGSSVARNKATAQDLTLQLLAAKQILKDALLLENLPFYEQLIYQIDGFLSDLNTNFRLIVNNKFQVSLIKKLKPSSNI